MSKLNKSDLLSWIEEEIEASKFWKDHNHDLENQIICNTRIATLELFKKRINETQNQLTNKEK
jgi:hypothetical protein